MRIPLFNMFRRSPFENVMNHAEKVAQCGPLFVRAVECYFRGDRETFEFAKEEIRDIEAAADRIKQNIRSHLPPSVILPMDKFVFFSFLREADKVVDCVKNSLYWMSYLNLSLPAPLEQDYVLLVREAGDYLGFLPVMVQRAHVYFGSRSEKDRRAVKEIIREIRWREGESDDLEKALFTRVCAEETLSPQMFFVTVRLVETTGDIADHLENSADMMRAMIAR